MQKFLNYIKTNEMFKKIIEIVITFIFLFAVVASCVAAIRYAISAQQRNEASNKVKYAECAEKSADVEWCVDIIYGLKVRD